MSKPNGFSQLGGTSGGTVARHSRGSASVKAPGTIAIAARTLRSTPAVSIQNRDRALLIGLVTVVMAAVIVANAIADVVAAALDPRVRTAAGIG